LIPLAHYIQRVGLCVMSTRLLELGGSGAPADEAESC